jgi:mannosyl-3-phosphoglycerate phosphatase
MRKAIFTDLDGTLLDRDTYSWEPARPAIDQLRRNGVPWVMVTSKTRAETEVLRERLGNGHPFVVENGGAAFIPHGYFPFPISGAARRDGYDAIEWGSPYTTLTAALDAAVRESGCRVRSFHEMTTEEIAAACDFSAEEAVLAQQREYDEPFVVLDPHCDTALLNAVAARGFRTTRGGRFYHVCGKNDKAVAVRELCKLYTRALGRVTTIGIGDAWNDVPFLETVNTPVIIDSAVAAEIKARLPRALVTEYGGPRGWNEAVLDLISPWR